MTLNENLLRALETVEETTFPKAVIVEVCGACNLKCIMCPYPNLKRQKGVMDLPTFRKIVDEIASKNKNTELWLAIMGEPLMFHGIFKYIKYAKDRIKEVILNTNGTLLNAKKYELLQEAGLDKLIIGMDAITEGTYEKIRIGGDFKRLNNTVLNLIRENINVRPEIILQFIVMPENEHEVGEFKRYWLPRGAKLKIRKKLGWGDAVNAAEGLQISPESIERVPCPWLMRTMSIQWNGKVAQCDADYEGSYSPGNVLSNSIEGVWGKLKERRDKHWNKEFGFSPCNTCRDWQVGLSEYYWMDTIGIRDLDEIYRVWNSYIEFDETDKNKIACMLSDSRGRDDVFIKLMKDGQIIGFMAYNKKGVANHVTGIVVLPEYKNQGYGTILVQSAENRILQRKESNEVILEVRKDNPSGLRFWEKCGYRKIDEIVKGLYYPDTEAVVFQKLL